MTREPANVNVNELSDEDLFRHYHDTAPVADLLFFMTHAHLNETLFAQAQGLLALAPNGKVARRAEWYRRLSAIQGDWRREREAAERQRRKADQALQDAIEVL